MGILIGIFTICVALPAAIVLIVCAWMEIGRTAIRLRCWRFGLADALLAMAVAGMLLALARNGFESLTDLLLFAVFCVGCPLLWLLRFGLEDWLAGTRRRAIQRSQLRSMSFIAPPFTSEHERGVRSARRPRLAITRRSGLTAPRIGPFSLLGQPLKFDE